MDMNWLRTKCITIDTDGGSRCQVSRIEEVLDDDMGLLLCTRISSKGKDICKHFLTLQHIIEANGDIFDTYEAFCAVNRPHKDEQAVVSLVKRKDDDAEDKPDDGPAK